jgi:O-antigen/teichoic acid export membrane protein
MFSSETILIELKRLVRQSSHYLFGLIGGLLLGFVSFPIFTRMFSVADYGLIDLAQKIILLAAAGAKAGLQNSALRFFNGESFAKDPAGERKYYSTMLWGVTAVAVALTLALELTLPVLRRSIVDPPLAALLSFGAVLVPIRAIQSLLSAFLRIQERTKFSNSLGVVTKAALIVAVLLLLPWMGRSVQTYYTAMISTEALAILVLLVPLFGKGLLNPAAFDKNLFAASLAFGVPMIAQELAGIALDSADRFLVRIYMGDTPLGLYSVAYGLAGYVNTLLYAPLGLAILPIYMRLWRTKGAQETSDFLGVNLEVFVMAAAGACALAGVGSRDAVLLLASAKYRGADALIPMLVLGQLIYTSQIFLNAGLLIHKRTGIMAANLGFAALLNIGLNCVLLPRMGLQGAAIATLVSYLVCTIALAHLSFHVLPMNLPWRSIAFYTVAAAAACGAGALIETEMPLLTLASRCILTSTVYLGALYMYDPRIRTFAGFLWRRLRRVSEAPIAA